MKRNTHTKEQIEDVVKTSNSIRQTLLTLGLAAKGGNYKSFHNKLKKYNISIAHFTGQAHMKGKKLPPIPIQMYLDGTKTITSHKLRIKLIAEGILPNRCSNCQMAEWLGNPMPLELDHKDGNHLNNKLENLCLLCPNCHTLTPTYRGKNKKKK